jgi:hypothetical protein
LGSLFTISFVVGIIILTLILLCIPVGLSILVYKLVRKKFNKYIALALASIIPLFCIYEIYDAIWPGDGFYRGHFKMITQIELPESGKIIRKDASWPDLHGDYCASALIELSNDDYRKLMEYVKGNKVFTDSSMMGSSQVQKVLGSINYSRITYEASYQVEDEDRGIGFLDDGRTIVISFASW